MHERLAREELAANPTYFMVRLAQMYNRHTGANVDHVRMRAMWQAFGPNERDDLLAILTVG